MKAYKQSKGWLASTVFKETHGETQPTRHVPPPKKIPRKSNFNHNEKEVVSSENENLLKKGCNTTSVSSLQKGLNV